MLVGAFPLYVEQTVMTESSKKNKVVLVGDFGVGKSTIFARFKTGLFVNVGQSTKVESECRKTLMVDGKEIAINLYDTAGMERFEGSITPSYFRNPKALIFVYSIDDKESIDNLPSWVEAVNPQRLEHTSHSTDNFIVALVGNKVDLDDEREVSLQRGKETAENLDIPEHLVFEISAKDGTGFEEMFRSIVREIKKGEGGSEETATVSLHSSSKRTSGSCGCMKKTT